jgi:hypothetical protein
LNNPDYSEKIKEIIDSKKEELISGKDNYHKRVLNHLNNLFNDNRKNYRNDK